MTVSIIIAVKTWQRHLEECVNKCCQLDFSDFEILILPDNPPAGGGAPGLPIGRGAYGTTVPITIIPTSPVSPAKKRDLAISSAKGEILAFIDDDAYPVKEWLKCALEDFKDDLVAAVGGPAITPQDDTLMQKASGMVYSSYIVSGKYTYRYLPKGKREIDDYPSCNLLVRKSVMEELGGFNTNFWPGEDTKLCLDITGKLKQKIIYDPRVLVYHHRRPLFLAHLKQIANYALHRGYFTRRYPQTSLRWQYFVPTLFLSGLIGGAVLSVALPYFAKVYLLGLYLYLFLVFIFSIYKDLRLIPLIFFGIITTHVAYGACFLKGLVSKRLKEEL